MCSTKEYLKPNFSADRLVKLKYMESVSDKLERSVDIMREFVRIREGQLTLPGEFCNVVNDIICFLCTNYRSVWCFIVYFLYESIINENMKGHEIYLQ